MGIARTGNFAIPVAQRTEGATMNIILGFDIGNTNTRMGIYAEGEISPRRIYAYGTEKRGAQRKVKKWVREFLSGYRDESGEELAVKGFAFSSVVPEVNGHYHKTAESLFNLRALEIDSSIKSGIEIRYDNPAELGADRITNAAAAYKEYGRDSIVIDFGTAITFCVVLKEGMFDGGLIAPGAGTAIDALSEKASRLIKVDFSDPGNIIAKNTKDALMSGFFYGWVSLVNGIIDRIEKEYSRQFFIILTGGYAEVISKYIERESVIDPLLTMKGIKYIYDLNLE